MQDFTAVMLTASKYLLVVFSAIILIRCLRSMLSQRFESETWGFVRAGKESIPVTHWENIIGRAPTADIRIDKPGVGRTHAILVRSDKGVWRIFDVFSRGEVWVNGELVGRKGSVLESGDYVNLSGSTVRFRDMSTEKRAQLEQQRTSAGARVSPALTLFDLTVFQALLLLQHAINAASGDAGIIALAFATLIILEWCLYNAMRTIGRTGFECETLAFYLTTLGMSVAATSTPQDLFKQILLVIASVLLFLLMGWWLRNLRRAKAMRVPIAIAALALMAVNVAAGSTAFGAQNWLVIGGYSFQPSELVKVAYIYCGASALDTLYRRNNLFVFIAFSAICVMALALIGDFGTALIFFMTFLVISFMRSGSIATVFLAVTGAVLACFLVLTVKPYIAQRFSTWGHVWEDVYNTGYQQTRAMSAAASGGLFGKGAGAGWLKTVFAANTDMVFAMICEELGLIIAVCAVMSILTLAFFAVRSARHSRSSYYAIAACATVSMLLVQLALNVFGSMDLLPFTGVTFPFVSRGGTSLISCWMMMAFIKAADTRRDASFVVRAVTKLKNEYDDYDEDEEAEEE